MKKCTTCGEVKPEDCFTHTVRNDRNNKKVVRSRCKDCCAKWFKEYYSKKKQSREFLSERASDMQKYRNENQEYRERSKTLSKKYYQTNKSEILNTNRMRTERLDDSYVAAQVRKINSGNLQPKHLPIPKTMINAKKAIMIFNRSIKTKQL